MLVVLCVCLHIGKSLGVAEVNPDVLELLSHATQERLRNLLEKLTVIAHHHNISYRVCIIKHICTKRLESFIFFTQYG